MKFVKSSFLFFVLFAVCSFCYAVEDSVSLRLHFEQKQEFDQSYSLYYKQMLGLLPLESKTFVNMHFSVQTNEEGTVVRAVPYLLHFDFTLGDENIKIKSVKEGSKLIDEKALEIKYGEQGQVMSMRNIEGFKSLLKQLIDHCEFEKDGRSTHPIESDIFVNQQSEIISQLLSAFCDYCPCEAVYAGKEKSLAGLLSAFQNFSDSNPIDKVFAGLDIVMQTKCTKIDGGSVFLENCGIFLEKEPLKLQLDSKYRIDRQTGWLLEGELTCNKDYVTDPAFPMSAHLHVTTNKL